MLMRAFRTLTFAVLLSALVGPAAIAAEPIKVAQIDPFSGPFANIGLSAQHAFQAEFDRLNAAGGALSRQFVLVPFDNKSSPQESALQVQAIVDQGIRYIIQGAGSNNGHAVSDAVAKYNSRNPQQPIVYLNHGALDPALTDEKCHFWHFRFVPHGHMIMAALTDALARDASVKSVYLINQDYVWGQGVAKDAREMLAARRPDIKIVGEDLHPIGKVKDFSSYVAKMKASGADAVVTGNWGNDLALLIKATNDAGLKGNLYAPLAGLQGAPTMMGESGVDRVRAAVFWHENVEPNPLIGYARAFRAKYNEDWVWLPNHLLPEMLTRAMSKAQSADPLQVALALENMRYAGPTGEVWMRPEDHQLMTPIFQTVFTRAGQRGVKYDAEGTGFGWKTEGKVDTKDNVPPVVCRVQRP
jgi:branched-chain amino acid transport system substrate-binding protein